MEIDEQNILNQVRQIYLREIMMFEECELDNDAYLGKMNGYKVDGDDLSLFAKGVLDDFDIPLLQSDWDTLGTLREVADFVVKKLKEKRIISDIET